MCFSQPASLGFGLLAVATGAFLKARGHPPRRYGLFLYFAMMEFIQFGAYSVVDQCDNPWNKVATFAAFIHVVMQNTVVNWFFLCPENGVHPDVTRLIIVMCLLCGGATIFSKVPVPVWLGAHEGLLDGLARWLPEFYSYSTAGTKEACMFESMCGPQLCTFSTPNHIAWSVPMLPNSYFLPCGFVHFFFFFFPTVIMGNTSARLTMLAAFFSGPVLTQMLAARNMPTYKFEWPATWCFMSVGQCFVALAVELYTLHQQRRQQQADAQAAKDSSCNGISTGRSSSPDSLAYIKPITAGKKE